MSAAGARGAPKIVVGVTGASGAPYAKRLLGVLAERWRAGEVAELACVLSDTAPEVWARQPHRASPSLCSTSLML